MITHQVTAGNKQFAVLLDPDKCDIATLPHTIDVCLVAGVDFFLLGASLLRSRQMPNIIQIIKSLTRKPVILFPGDTSQVEASADAILLLSLISGRNPELLIGNHVRAAMNLQQSGLEILPTGYMIIDGGKGTSVSYMSQSMPIPHDKPDIASATALAGQMLGLKMIYLDTGSGALHTVSSEMLGAVKEVVNLPLFVGGGIKKPEQAAGLSRAGADIIVVGTAIEQDVSLASELVHAVHESSSGIYVK